MIAGHGESTSRDQAAARRSGSAGAPSPKGDSLQDLLVCLLLANVLLRLPTCQTS